MPIDLFQSRRTYNSLCRWWSRNEDEQYELDKLVLNRVPSGLFWAKETASEQYQDNVVNGMFMFDRTTVVIKSPDDLTGIKSEDIVEYEGELWMVRSVQKRKARIQQSEFASNSQCSHYWFIELRK